MTSKEKILRSAQELFGKYGYNETTFKKISEHAGVAFGLISHYYGNKEKLYVIASMSVLDEVRRRVQEASSVAEDGITSVLNFTETYLNCSIDPDLNFFILVRCSPYSDVKDSVVQDDIVQQFEELIKDLARCIELGTRDGTVIKCDPVKMANTIFSTMVGSLRTKLLAPYCPDNFFEHVLLFIRRAVENKGPHQFRCVDYACPLD